MIYKAKKMWMGHVSIRDYMLEKCIHDKEDLTVNLYGETKTYPYKSLRTYLTNTYNETFKSKFGGRDYRLIDFPW